MKYLCLLAFPVLLFSCGQGSNHARRTGPVVDSDAIQRLNVTLQSFVDDSLVVGVSALIYEKGEEVYFKALGYADREAGTPMDRNSIVTIYSMTEPITGVTLMSLYDEGKFKLDDRLPDYLPEYRGMEVCVGTDETGDMVLTRADREISIRDITRHTAGFSQREDLGLHVLHWQADLFALENTLLEMSRGLSEIPLGFQPGSRWEYGASVDVQARLIEQLMEKPFDEVMRERVLDPLGMAETGYFIPEEKRGRVAALYNRNRKGQLKRVPDEIHSINYREWPMKPGGWGLKSTIDDYMSFAQMLVNEGTYKGAKVLDPKTVQLMATNHLPAFRG